MRQENWDTIWKDKAGYRVLRTIGPAQGYDLVFVKMT